MCLSGGSVKNPMLQNFEIVFKLIPLIPSGLLDFILEKKIYKSFRFLPLGLLLDFLIIVKNREYNAFDYITHYLRNIFLIFKAKNYAADGVG